eukprot:GHVQ01020604.1.p1 GENE.GHVQ01020604.1~~GHVQ01020604.1.p1  ORF type:complete len:623 (+),score=60.96 GHVQ01020604.1:83-1951(+)
MEKGKVSRVVRRKNFNQSGRNGKGKTFFKNKTHGKGSMNRQGGWRQADLSGKHRRDNSEIEELERRIKAELPKAGEPWLPKAGQNVDRKYKENDCNLTEYAFSDLPLSSHTLEGLARNNFVRLTGIQYAAIPQALCDRDVLGEAKTGSGKTLCFIVPILEKLYRMKWSKDEGLAALVITPTRELAAQIYGVCILAGKCHDFSAGCIIGGKSIEEENSRINLLNILIATPGRLQQHMEESPLWDASNLQLLVVDEADRMLDMGFMESVKFIVSQLPCDRQTLLFSATLRSAVRQLALIAVKPNPVRVSVDAESPSRTPTQLNQVCVVVPLEDKVNTLFSFLKSHSSSSILVFVSSCKEVRFLHDAFQQLNCGLALMELHGRQCQQKRIAVYEAFKHSKGRSCLISTDLASRGIDFPAVDWVVQMDCPDCVDTYIHRVGRTARFQRGGNGLLLLTPSETTFLKRLQEKRIPVKQIALNPRKSVTITGRLQTVLKSQPPLMYLAQRAVVSYLKSIALMRDKAVFKLEDSSANNFARSLGLPAASSCVAVSPDPTASSDQTAADIEDIVTGNSVIVGGADKKRKNSSKLERLKARIREKKLRKTTQETENHKSSAGQTASIASQGA